VVAFDVRAWQCNENRGAGRAQRDLARSRFLWSCSSCTPSTVARRAGIATASCGSCVRILRRSNTLRILHAFGSFSGISGPFGVKFLLLFVHVHEPRAVDRAHMCRARVERIRVERGRADDVCVRIFLSR